MPKAKENKIVVESNVARFLTVAINKSGKLQADIAREVGFPMQNMITMIKQGRSKMPIAKIKLMADSLEIDPKELLRLCFEEYQPGNWAVIEEIFRE